MIPKVIHYIWLGGKPLPKIAKKCIKSWEKYCPGYEIKRWDESNLDINKYEFTNDAYQAKKYAFVSDVMRTEILYNEGGIYLDIDVELIKSLDDILKDIDCVMGFETSNFLNPGLFIASKSNDDNLKNILNIYKNLKFDLNNLDKITVCEVYTKYYEKLGLKKENKTQILENTKFYSSEYFSPKSLSDGKIRKTKNTVSIHHYCATWVKGTTKFKSKILQLIKRILGEKAVRKFKEKRKKKNESASSSCE